MVEAPYRRNIRSMHGARQQIMDKYKQPRPKEHDLVLSTTTSGDDETSLAFKPFSEQEERVSQAGSDDMNREIFSTLIPRLSD